MYRRTAEANKAIAEKWAAERVLVSEGKGTRDWTPEQQKDILEKGKAYDENGLAFQGQHMKSVEAYPDYQGTPDNIQFLTKQEHLDAHGGNWKNPTNWYYNPETKECMEFGNDEIISCEVILLRNPIVSRSEINCAPGRDSMEALAKEDKNTDDSEINASRVLFDEVKHGKSRGYSASKKLVRQKESAFIRALKGVKQYIVEHPAETIEIVLLAVGGIGRAIYSSRSSKNSSGSANGMKPSHSTESNIASAVAEVIEQTSRSSPREHEVPGHGQHYHTKDGIIWKEKGSYRRGG